MKHYKSYDQTNSNPLVESLHISTSSISANDANALSPEPTTIINTDAISLDLAGTQTSNSVSIFDLPYDVDITGSSDVSLNSKLWQDVSESFFNVILD